MPTLLHSLDSPPSARKITFMKQCFYFLITITNLSPHNHAPAPRALTSLVESALRLVVRLYRQAVSKTMNDGGRPRSHTHSAHLTNTLFVHPKPKREQPEQARHTSFFLAKTKNATEVRKGLHPPPNLPYNPSQPSANNKYTANVGENKIKRRPKTSTSRRSSNRSAAEENNY